MEKQQNCAVLNFYKQYDISSHSLHNDMNITESFKAACQGILTQHSTNTSPVINAEKTAIQGSGKANLILSMESPHMNVSEVWISVPLHDPGHTE